MKKIWQYGRSGGKELEVSDDFSIQVPFTDIPPLEEIKLEDQFFIPSEGRWKEIINGLDKEKLDNLTALYPVLESENLALKEKAESLTQINSKTMLASLQNSKEIESIKQQLNEGGE